jgi:hypothetical protein
MKQHWNRYVTAMLAGCVAMFLFWIVWVEVSFMIGTDKATSNIVTVGVGVAVVILLLNLGKTTGEIWAWGTLTLGVESLAWPLAKMIQLRLTTSQPNEAQMGEIVVAILFGLFSSIFWFTFAYGIFRWLRRDVARETPDRPAR